MLFQFTVKHFDFPQQHYPFVHIVCILIGKGITFKKITENFGPFSTRTQILTMILHKLEDRPMPIT